MITAAIVEDHPVYRHGLVQAIDATPALDLVITARSIEDFQAQVLTRPDVVILDLSLPGGMEGTEAVDHLAAQGLAVLVVSASDRQAAVVDAIGAGAAAT